MNVPSPEAHAARRRRLPMVPLVLAWALLIGTLLYASRGNPAETSAPTTPIVSRGAAKPAEL